MSLTDVVLIGSEHFLSEIPQSSVDFIQNLLKTRYQLSSISQDHMLILGYRC